MLCYGKAAGQGTVVSFNQLRTVPNGQLGTSVPAQNEVDFADNLQEPEREL